MNVPPDPARTQFVSLLANALAEGSFRKLVLAKGQTTDGCQRVDVRQVLARNEPLLAIVQTFPTNDITKSVGTEKGMAFLRPLVLEVFLRGHLTTATEQIDLSVSKRGSGAIHRSQIRPVPIVAHGHDRPKMRFVDQDRPFLTELGVTDPAGKVIPSMARKWKQINKFVEIVDGAIKQSDLKSPVPITVADFGSGKGYLTFALHDYLRTALGYEVTTVGVEQRDDLVAACNLAAQRADANGLTFLQSDIESAVLPKPMDVLVALHACDTATDKAIHRGIAAGAQVIICSPCCHKELRPQIKSPVGLASVLRNGVHLGLTSEMVTDTMRALVLEEQGYDTKIFEFVGLEDTSKNKMILAVKRTNSHGDRAGQAFAERNELKSMFGIQTQYLERLLSGSSTDGVAN